MFKYVVPLILDGLRSRLILVGFVVICLQYLFTSDWLGPCPIFLSARHPKTAFSCQRCHGFHQVLGGWKGRVSSGALWFWDSSAEVPVLSLEGIGAIWCCAAGKGRGDGSSFRDWVTVSPNPMISGSTWFQHFYWNCPIFFFDISIVFPRRSCKSLHLSCGTWRSSSRVVRIRRMLRGIQQAWRE